MIIIDAPSPNFGPRAEGKKIKYLILHYTGTPTAFKALQLLQGSDPSHKVSAHYLVDEEGQVMRIVEENMRAWHAGKSYWEGEEDLNSTSIGIEIQNPGHEHGYRAFPPEQIKAVADLCRAIIARHNILPAHVLAHSDIAPERKEDPGELFPWKELAHEGIGLWPQHCEDEAPEIEDMLTAFGYDPRVALEKRITAFQRHFEPEIFATPNRVGWPNLNTVQRLQSLLRQKQAGRARLS